MVYLVTKLTRNSQLLTITFMKPLIGIQADGIVCFGVFKSVWVLDLINPVCFPSGLAGDVRLKPAESGMQTRCKILAYL